MAKLDLLVVAGGRSAERDVSCISAAAIVRNADRSKYNVRIVHIDSRGRWLLVSDPKAFSKGTPASLEFGTPRWLRAGGRSYKIDVVFPALHGPMGEDGTIQGLFEIAQVPYVGSGVLGSAVGMDKALSKRLAAQAGLPQLPYVVVERGQSLAPARKLRFPVFVKPARLGSSVGVFKVSKPSGLAAAARKSFAYDTTIVIEQGIAAREIECALLGDEDGVKASTVGEIRPNAEFYSYHAKYLDPNGAQILVPAELNAAQTRRVRALAALAFQTLGCHGLARADFFLDKKDGRLYFNEVNTLPGFTQMSLYPRLWASSGIPFPRLIDRLVGLAMKRAKSRAGLKIKP